MKKNISAILSAVIFLFSACTEDTLDRINKDNAHPTPDAVPAVLQLSDAIMSTGFSTVSGDYAFYLASLNEQVIGIGNNQLMHAELRNSSEWAASTTFNNVWNSTYGNLMNIREIIRKVSTNVPGNINQFDLLGVAQVLEALNFGVLTDLHGDIPYSEALKGQAIMQPKLDNQSDIYAGIISTLDEAIANLNKAIDEKKANIAKYDIAFQGDKEQWLATAYSLKARYLLRQLAQNPSVLAQVETAAQKAVDLNFEGCSIDEFNGTTADNPWSAFVFSRSYSAPSKTVTNIMESNSDPRLDFYINAKGLSYNPGDEDIAKFVDNTRNQDYQPGWYLMGSQPLHLFSKSELYFILAEVQLRNGVDATTSFRTAVSSSVTEIFETFEEDASSADDFAESLGVPNLKMLFEQKYIAQAYDEQIETYNDLRRLKAMGEEYVVLTNPWNIQSGLNRYPERLPYGNSGVIGNPNIKNAYGDGTYIYTQKTWVNNK